MQIPRINVVITQGGRDYVLSGALDTGYDGLALLKPSVQQARGIGMPIIGYMDLAGFGGQARVPLMKADSISIQGSPKCAIQGPQIAIADIPGSEDILLGEAFFTQFSFDIDYKEGQPVVIVCGEKVQTIGSPISDFWNNLTSQSWFLPAIRIGLPALALVAYLWLATPKKEPAPEHHPS